MRSGTSTVDVLYPFFLVFPSRPVFLRPPFSFQYIITKTVFNENHVLSLSLSLSSPSKSLYAFGSTPDFQSAELPL